MIIHKDNLAWDDALQMWRYHLSNIGGDNEATVYFTAPNNVTPKTGDVIINNRWVKGED